MRQKSKKEKQDPQELQEFLERLKYAKRSVEERQETYNDAIVILLISGIEKPENMEGQIH
mgnify:CR=1 FL=1